MELDGSLRAVELTLADSAIGVRDGDALVAYAALAWSRSADAFVLPSHRGRGIGTALVRWTGDAARALGYPAVGQPVHERAEAAIAPLRAHGHEHVGMTPRGTYLHLERPLR
jgi:GNAT superfamily N-acetyltransferase